MRFCDRKSLLIAAASSALWISPALAEQAEPRPQLAQELPQMKEKGAEPGQAQQKKAAATSWSAEKLLDANVRTPGDDEIGEIEDLLIDDQGRIVSAVVETGGFLGLGSKRVALPFNELQLQRGDDGNIRVRSNATVQQLEQAPEYKGDD